MALASDVRRARSLAIYDELIAEDDARVADACPPAAPMLLVGQVQRSGGTLLSRLLDGHPEVLAYPLELYWGRPDELRWPDVDLASPPEEVFRELAAGSAHQIRRFTREGYGKYGAGGAGELLPFSFSLAAQRRAFLAFAPFADRRTALDAYLRSFFAAWHRTQGAARWVSAFGKRHNLAATRAGFFADYPDGRLVTVVREPASWLASAQRHDPRAYGDTETALAIWAESTRASIEARRARPARVLLLTFESLVGETDHVMRAVAEWAGLEWDAALLTPTFGGQPVASNSSFAPARGIDASALSRTGGAAQVPGEYSALAEEARSLAPSP